MNGLINQFYGTYGNIVINSREIAEEERKGIGLEPLNDYFRKRKIKLKCKND